MNREDIIRMAREAGMTGLESGGLLENFEHFAALVAAFEREECAKLCDLEGLYATAADVRAGRRA